LIDGKRSRKEILAHPDVKALMEKRYVSKYENDRFLRIPGLGKTSMKDAA